MKFLPNSRILWNLTRRTCTPNLTAANMLAPSNVLLSNLKQAHIDGGAKGDAVGNKAPHEGEKTKKKVPKCESSQKLLNMHVLPLDEVMKRFLLTCQPLLTQEEMKITEDAAKDFVKNEAVELQCLLEEAGKKECNWLSPRWLLSAYLQYRDPVTVYSSPGMSFPLQNFADEKAYLDYTAKVIYGLGEFKALVDAGKIPVIKMGKYELDNSQFGKVMGTCRVPCRFTDLLIYEPCSTYVVVIYKNAFFKLPIFTKEYQLIKASEIAQQLALIMSCQKEPGPEYGLLTTDTRDNWAEAYMLGHRMKGFEESVEVVQKCLFTVCLDQNLSVTPGQESSLLGAQLIHGGGPTQNGANRWMDKTVQLVSNPNGMVGFTYEHSPAEGQPIAMMMDYVVKKMSDDPQFGECGECFGELGSERICFPPVNTCMESWIHVARRNLADLAGNLQLNVHKFSNFGKDWIKKFKLGPDSFIQMAIQLAYYRIHKKPGAQYESAHLRIFNGGRTETIRSCSNESLAFCRAMCDKKLEKGKKAEIIRSAVAAHQGYTKLALQGRGVDRHLLGLKLMALENCKPVPEFYKTPGFVKSANFVVSTSQVASVYEAFMCYGPLVKDGYGCCYNPRECDIIFAVSAFVQEPSTDAVEFCKQLEWALQEMYTALGGQPQCKL